MLVVHACVNMYADETELHCSGDDLHQVQGDLHLDIYRIQQVKCFKVWCNNVAWILAEIER